MSGFITTGRSFGVKSLSPEQNGVSLSVCCESDPDRVRPLMWLRSRSDPLRLGEVVQAVVVLAFAFAIPILVVPTIAVLVIVLLERLGFTLLGKIVVLLIIAAIIWISLIALGYLTPG